jgi:NADPH-dependent 2,4-dienoyl-CoA reductase/sulfur reductase-like enzyme
LKLIRRLGNDGRIVWLKAAVSTGLRQWTSPGDGNTLSGYAGDTLASALMANGERVLGRSFKYHRPRGIMSAGVEESGAIVTVGEGARREPNVRATVQELYDGLCASGQNAWPNVRFDLGAVNGLFSRFFVAGFYYKTFMGLPPFEWGHGTGLWMQYEKLIRKAAGMGAASREPDPDCYNHVHAFCDVLVVGSGPAGLQAALTAAQAGRDVLLVEQDFELGGDYLNDPGAEKHRLECVNAVKGAGVRVMTRTTAFGLYDDGVAGLLEKVTDHLANPDPELPRQRFWTVRAGATILATGALERSIAFENNDRPGVMTAAAARSYLNRYGILPGQKIVISTTNDSVYAAAAELAAAGAEVIVADNRDEIDIDLPNGVTIRNGVAPMKVLGRSGVEGVDLAKHTNGSWAPAGKEACDLFLVSGGWSRL